MKKQIKLKRKSINKYVVLPYSSFKELYLDTNIRPHISLHKEYVVRCYEGDSDFWTSIHYFILLDFRYILSGFNNTKYNGYGWLPIEFYDENVLHENLRNERYGRTSNINLCVEQYPKVDKYNDYENIKYHYEICREHELKVIEEKNKVHTGWGCGEEINNIPSPKYIETNVYYGFITGEYYKRLLENSKIKEEKKEIRYNKIRKWTHGLIDISLV